MGYDGIDMGYTRDAAESGYRGAPGFGRPNAVFAGGVESLVSSVPANIIGTETGWRRPPESSPFAIRTTRWGSTEHRTVEASAETPADTYIVGLVLRPMDIRLSVRGRVVHDGIAAAGMLHVSEPCAPATGLFRGAYDALHLHVPGDLLREYAGRHGSALLRSQPTPDRDPIALKLGLSLLEAEQFTASFGQIYADSISLAIVTRLLALQNGTRPARARADVAPMSKWRLQRAIAFIDAHIDESISLAGVAAAAGLSRMHFAAQFKAATGDRPHEYVLRRRISRAQDLMTGSAASLVDIALQVGFQNQAHFTTVFKRFAGQPPNAWRRSRQSG